MKSMVFALGTLTAILLAGCGPRDRRDTGTAGGAGMGTEDTAMAPAGRGDTGMQSGDTNRNRSGTERMGHTSGGVSDSGARNQTESGVTNTQTGKSTLGHGVSKTRPDAGEPVTSKGDTIRGGGDSVSR